MLVMSSYLIRGTAAQDTLRVVAVESTALVGEARQRHGASLTATAALGRAMSASLLLSQLLTKDEPGRVNLRVQGGGPVGWIVAEGSRDGTARGYARNPEAELPPRDTDGKLDVGALVGTDGELAVTRLLDNGEPYTGSVPLASGEIAQDVATYLLRSEQIPSAVLLGVHLDAGGVTSAGGVIVQAMPGASEATLALLEANVAKFGALTTHLRAAGLLGALDRLLDGLHLKLEADSLPVSFACRCSRSRAVDALAFFDAAEREDMISQGGQEVVCHWCGERYLVMPPMDDLPGRVVNG